MYTPLKSNAAMQRGFTMVELITIIIIIGIIGATVMPKFFDNATYQNRAAADQVRAALKFGQKTAIAQHHQVTVLIDSAAQTNCTDTVTINGNNTVFVDCLISNSVTLTSAGTFNFNPLGQPVPNSAGSINVGGTVITIEQETGYVH
jgi:MSHA pilin protein MshC